MKKELIHFVEWKKIPEEQVEPTLAELQEWGVTNIVAHPNWFRDGAERYVEKMAKRLNRFGLLSTACHALWGGVNDCIQPDFAVRREMIRKHTAFMDELAVLGVSTYTLHLGYDMNADMETNFALLRRTVEVLLPAAERNRITLAIENSAEPLPVIRRLAETVREYRTEFVRLCYDSGHANCYQKSVAETLDIMREGIVTCHLHDNNGSFDDHNPPGGGSIDWSELSRLLAGLPRLHHMETESGAWDRESWEKFCRAMA